MIHDVPGRNYSYSCLLTIHMVHANSTRAIVLNDLLVELQTLYSYLFYILLVEQNMENCGEDFFA